MTRRFRNRFSPRRDDDAALDALLAGTWEDGATAMARVLDLEAGKAALLAALGRQEPSGPGAGQGSVREQIDALLAAVTAETRSNGGAAHSAITANLYAARQFLIQLRAGLARRTLAKGSALDLAELIGGIRQQLPALSRKIEQLFDEADDPALPIPVPTR